MQIRFHKKINVCCVLVALIVSGQAAAQRYDAYSLSDSVTVGERFDIVVRSQGGHNAGH